MNKQIKKLASNHQFLVRDTKTGKTYLINKDDASNGIGEFDFQEDVLGNGSVAEKDIPLFIVDGENIYLTNTPFVESVIGVVESMSTTNSVTINTVSTLGTSPVTIVDNIPLNSGLFKGRILIKYFPGTTAYANLGDNPVFKILDQDNEELPLYPATAKSLVEMDEYCWNIPLDLYVSTETVIAKKVTSIDNLKITLANDNGLLDPEDGDGYLKVTVEYSIISI